MNRVTCFVTTIGCQTFAECMHALSRSAVVIDVKVIENVAPFSAALQQMSDDCRTELFVQVDEDMILDSFAIARLMQLMDESPKHAVMGMAPLWDSDIMDAIFGVKIYRHELVRQVPFVDHPDGDVNNRRRWAAAGFSWVSYTRARSNCVGMHGTSYTPEQIFERWRRLWRKHRRTGMLDWIEAWPKILRARYEKSASRRDLFALLGATIGMTEPLADEGGPDFRRENPTLDAAVAAFP